MVRHDMTRRMLESGGRISNFDGMTGLSLCVYCYFDASIALPVALEVDQQDCYVLLGPSPCLWCVGSVNGKRREEDLGFT